MLLLLPIVTGQCDLFISQNSQTSEYNKFINAQIKCAYFSTVSLIYLLTLFSGSWKKKNEWEYIEKLQRMDVFIVVLFN